MPRYVVRNLLLLNLLFMALSCGDDPPATPSNDVGTDQGTDLDAATDASQDMPDMEVVDPNNPGLLRSPIQPDAREDLDINAPVAIGEARVARVVGDSGFRGLWAHCREGDFKLVNAQIEVCVQSETTNRNEVFTGGMIVDAKPAGSAANDLLDMLKPRVGFNVHYAESVEVVRDGSKGGPAVIRVEGRDMPIAYLLGVLGGRFLNSDNLRLTTEYRLYPDASDVEIVTWIVNPNDGRKVVTPGDWLAIGDRSREFWSTTGTGANGSQAFEWVGTFGPSASFGWTLGEPTKRIDLPVSNAPFIIFDPGAVSMTSGMEHVTRRWFAVGDGSVESVRRTMLKRLGTDTSTWQERTIRLNPAIPNRTVELSNSTGAVTLATTNASGEVKFLLEDGTYRAKVAPVAGQLPIEADLDFSTELEQSVEVSTPAQLRVRVTDPAGPGVALVKVIGGPANSRHEFFSMPTNTPGVGEVVIDVVPGSYQLYVSRGTEYAIHTQTGDISASGAEVDVVLERTVDTTGFIGADFHQHMEPSTDSQINVRERLLDNVAEGIEFVVSTDHDVVTDLRPYLDELGLADYLGTFPGMEVSPTIGHVNVYPAPYDRSRRGNGTIELAYMQDEEVKIRTIPDIFAAARAMPHNPVVQLNHPRGSSSLFETANYSPDQDPRTFQHREWSTDFDTLEIINRVRSTCALMADWSSFLNAGLIRTGLGNSDSHDLRGDPAGSPRNFLAINTQPGLVTQTQVLDALKQGRVSVGSYAFMDLGNVTPGDTLPVTEGQPFNFQVRVQTPEWSQATRLYAIVNGQVVESRDRSGNNGHDFDDQIAITVNQDSWVIFFAVGPQPSAPEAGDYSNPTIAFTNPVFLDVGSDGWQAPGVTGAMPTVDLAAINNPAFCE